MLKVLKNQYKPSEKKVHFTWGWDSKEAIHCTLSMINQCWLVGLSYELLCVWCMNISISRLDTCLQKSWGGSFDLIHAACPCPHTQQCARKIQKKISFSLFFNGNIKSSHEGFLTLNPFSHILCHTRNIEACILNPCFSGMRRLEGRRDWTKATIVSAYKKSHEWMQYIIKQGLVCWVYLGRCTVNS